MSIKPRVAKTFKFSDPKLDRVIDEIIGAIQSTQLTSADLVIPDVASSIGAILTSGQINALRRLLDGEDSFRRLRAKGASIVSLVQFVNDNQTGSTLRIEHTNNGRAVSVQGDSIGSLFKITQGTVNDGKVIEIENIGSGDSIYDDSGAKLTDVGVWTDAPCLEELKDEIIEVSDAWVLDGIKSLTPVKTWKYKPKNGAKRLRHMGPDVQEFSTVFGLGDETGIAPKDVASLALRACQALANRVEELQQKNDSLEARILALEAI